MKKTLTKTTPVKHIYTYTPVKNIVKNYILLHEKLRNGT